MSASSTISLNNTCQDQLWASLLLLGSAGSIQKTDLGDPRSALFILFSASESRNICYLDGIVFLVSCFVLSAPGVRASATTSTQVIILLPTRLVLLVSHDFWPKWFRLAWSLTIEKFIRLWLSVRHTIQYGTWSNGRFGFVCRSSFVGAVRVWHGFPVSLHTLNNLEAFSAPVVVWKRLRFEWH